MTIARRLQRATLPLVSAMPTSSPAGWTRIYSQDFTTPVARGGFVNSSPDNWFLDQPNPYANSLRSYPDAQPTTGSYSLYYASKTVDVVTEQYGARGVLRTYGHSETINGQVKSLAAALFPVIVPNAPTNDGKVSQVYGRYNVRFRTIGGYPTANGAPDAPYGVAFLLWPATNRWVEGEVDYPEMAWGSNIKGFVHEINNPSNNALYFSSDKLSEGDWHVATIEWYPTTLVFYLDGQIIGHTTDNVPTTPFRWGMQCGGHSATPAPDTSGYLLIDWMTVDSYNGAVSPV